MKLVKEDTTKPFNVKGPAGTNTVAPLTQKQKDDLTKSGAQVTPLEEQAGRKYTAEESQAVGKVVGKSLLKVLRAQGDEVVDIRLTGVGLNKFNIRVKYGNDKGHDVFKFILNPDTENITLQSGAGQEEQLVDFVITQGNTVSLPSPQLEDKLSDIMKKYVSEPSPEEYDQMAAMEPEQDDSQINKYIPEATKGKNEAARPDYPDLDKDGNTKESMKKALQDKKLNENTNPELTKYVNRFVGGLAKMYDYSTQDAVYAIMDVLKSQGWEGLNEDLEIGHQDNEPEMLKADLYKIAKYAVSLYKMMDELQHHNEVDFPHWWQAKVIKASSYLASAKHYLEFERNQPAMDTVVATLGEAKGTCCHKCGHVHVKGTSHPTPYSTGKKNCKFRD